jgi:hypothetical protein
LITLVMGPRNVDAVDVFHGGASVGMVLVSQDCGNAIDAGTDILLFACAQ